MDEIPKNKNVEEVKHGTIETWERQQEIITKLLTLQKSQPFTIVVSFIHWTTFSWSITYHMFGYILRLDSPPPWGSFYFLCKSGHPRQINVSNLKTWRLCVIDLCMWFFWRIMEQELLRGSMMVWINNGVFLKYRMKMTVWWWSRMLQLTGWWFFFFLSLYDVLLSLVVINVHLNLWFSLATLR